MKSKQKVSVGITSRWLWMAGGAALGMLADLSPLPRLVNARELPAGAVPRGAVSAGEAVGTLGGAVSVGVTGGVSWTSALKAVPGPGGMAPSLSIGYGSGGGYGGLGVGFSLHGVSSLSRCMDTHGQDGRAETIGWDASDRLCLDGERLVAVSGTYGADGTEYRLKSAGTTRIVGRKASTDSLSGFTVYTPDGGVTEYGAPTAGNWNRASVIARLAGGKDMPLLWSIHHREDVAGNRIEYVYTGEDSAAPGALMTQDHRLAQIDYGINGNAGSGATRRIRFDYASVAGLLGPAALDGAAVQRGYVAGVAFEHTRVLTDMVQDVRVSSGQAWSEVRRYTLGYEAVPTLKDQAPPDQVRLVTLRECDGAKHCFPDTRFEWSASPVAQGWQPWPGFAYDGVPFYPLPPAKEIKDTPYRRPALQVMGDFNADGTPDMLISPEWVNSDEGANEHWELWRTQAGGSQPMLTNIPAWSATGWINRTGGKVVADSFVQTPQAPRTGRRRDVQAVASAWAVNVDGSYGTDVLIGRPQAELAGAPMDPPWGYGEQSYRERSVYGAPDYCPGYYALDMPGYTPEEVVKINAGFYEECETYLGKSPSNLTEHPGIMAGFALWRLKPGTDGEFEQQDLHYPSGHPALWALPEDLNGDDLTDLVFCRADADYAAVAGQPLPMYYRKADKKTNWVSGTLRYALSTSNGLDLSDGGTPVVDTNGTAQRCHLKDALYTLDLYGDGRESVLFHTHPTAGAQTVEEIDWPVPEGEVADPYPYDANDATLTSYDRKLVQKVYAEWTTGKRYYRALTWTGHGVVVSNTGLPYDDFMRWQGTSGNATVRYSRYQPTQPSDIDEPFWGKTQSNRRVGWGRPDAPEAGYGLGEARFADVNRDGLTDVVMVDMEDCRYATNQTGKYDWPLYKPRDCSFQDVMEFGHDLWEQTYEKLAITIYANRGDGTFEVLQQFRPWDTDLYSLNYSGTQLGNALLHPGSWNNAEDYAIYKEAWTIATRATRQWRTEFASSQFGDGNGDGVADLGRLALRFEPAGGWINDTMAGWYAVAPLWWSGRLGGGLREEAAPMLGGLDLSELMPTKGGVPPWKDDGTLWDNGDGYIAVSPYEQQEYGLPVRWQRGDFNHDGVSDVMLYDHVAATWRFARGVATNTEAPAPLLLTAVVNGLGERTEIAYAPQRGLLATGQAWTLQDLTLPYPWISRPTNALAVAQLRQDNGGEAQGKPTFNTTTYRYGKSISDGLRGVALGPNVREIARTVMTESGPVISRRIERYDNAPNYDAALGAYPLAGTLRSETTLVMGGKDEPIHITHSGYRYAGKAGVKPGTWRRELTDTTASTYEIGEDADPGIAKALLACLPAVFDGEMECTLGQDESYHPLTHTAQTIAYDDYGYATTEVSTSAGATTVSERKLKHQDTLKGYVLGLPTVAWVANEPEAGAGYTVRTTAYSYYPDGRLKETTVEPNRVDYRHSEELTYDAFGNVKERSIKSDSGGWMTTTYAYSDSGVYVREAKNPAGHVTTSVWQQAQYEACGVPEQTTDALGRTAVADIDTFCRTTGQGTYAGAKALAPKVLTSYAEWEPQGKENYKDVEILATTAVAGGASSYTITDRLGRTIVTQAPGFGFDVYTQTRYDALGRATAVSLPTKVGEPIQGWNRTRYDALSRVREVERADGVTSMTRVRRYVSEVTDPLGNTSRSTVNALGQMVQIDPPEDKQQPNQAMCYRYGAFGALRRIEPCHASDTKLPVVMSYDDYGRLIQTESAALGMRQTRYDQLGRVWTTTDAKGTVTRLLYDKLGRVTERIEADGTPAQKSATWHYDKSGPGLLDEAINSDNTVSERPVYDDYARPIGQDITIYGETFRPRYSYDPRGRIATTTAPSPDPDQAVIVGAVYNDKDQRIGTTYQGQLVWEPLEADVFGHTTRQRYGNGLQTHATYDAQTGELNDATVWKTVSLNGQPPTQVAIEQFTYSWYDNGWLERRTKKGLVPNVTDQSDTFYYTPRGELLVWATIGANNLVQSPVMSYDGFGNIEKGPAGSYTYQGERLQSISGNAGKLTYQYDANGNVKVRTHNGTSTVLDYDALNRVKGIQDGATQSTYLVTYDADGAKVHVKETATGRETVYLGGYQLDRVKDTNAIERHNLGPVHLTRVWSGKTFAETRTWLTLADHLGSLSLVTDDEGGIKEERSYGVWGEERDPKNWVQKTIPPQNDLTGPASGYTGHERKAFGALMDMNARYYDPLAQRMIQADGVVPGAFNPLAWNAYAYTYNSPVGFTDPSGHAPQRREFTEEQNRAAMIDSVNGMIEATNDYGAANGFARMGGYTGMLFSSGLSGAMRLARAVNEIGRQAQAQHQQEFDNAPGETRQDRYLKMAFQRDWQNFVNAGKAPPFRTFQEYKAWKFGSAEARAGDMSGSMMEDAAATAEGHFRQAVGGGARGLRQARVLAADPETAGSSAAAQTEDPGIQTAGDGGNAPWWKFWRRKQQQQQRPPDPMPPGMQVLLPVNNMALNGRIWLDGKIVANLRQNGGITIVEVTLPNLTSGQAIDLANQISAKMADALRTQGRSSAFKVFVNFGEDFQSQRAFVDAQSRIANPYGSMRGSVVQVDAFDALPSGEAGSPVTMQHYAGVGYGSVGNVFGPY